MTGKEQRSHLLIYVPIVMLNTEILLTAAFMLSLLHARRADQSFPFMIW
jgi:hypothetical protein